MSLSLAAKFVEQKNLVVPLVDTASNKGAALRVASSASGTLGTLAASGSQSNSVIWGLYQNPTWVSLSTSADSLTATLSFSNAQAQTTPYQFYVSATDGVTTVYFAVFLEVRSAFSVVAANRATSFTVPSYDSTVADIVFYGVGQDGTPGTNVSFIPPAVLPPGMKFITSDGGAMKLRVAEPSSDSVSGGISLYQGSPVSTQVVLEAYQPGTLYDNPSRCYSQAFTIESLTAKQATVDMALAVQYNATLNAFELDSYVDFLNGEAQAFTYQWIVTGTATGTITSGGTSTSSSLVWTPSTAGNVGFTLNILSQATGAIIGQVVVAPNIPCAPNGSWAGSNAIKIELGNPSARGYVGDQPTITISTPAAELANNETVTVSLALSTASSVETTATLAASTVTLTQAQPSATIQLTIPASSFNQKWIVSATAANATSNPTRTGYAQAAFLSNGAQPLTVHLGLGLSLTSNVGQQLSVLLSATNAQGASVSGVTYSLCGAPNGLFINGNWLTGNVLQPGTYTFTVVAEAAGYARSYSAQVTLVASAFAVPLSISGAVPSVASLPDNQQFKVSWGYSGTPETLNMIQGYTVRSVIGMTETTTSEVGASVVTIYGTSFYGDAYSIPALVLSSSIVALGQLPNAPTIGTIDENNNLTLNWTPLTVNGTYQAYKAWNIWLQQIPNGSPQLQSIAGSLPTGLEAAGSTNDSRIFKTVVSAGDWQVNMQALTADTTVALNAPVWDNAHAFPTAATASSVSFDNQTIARGQTVTITLDPNYSGADLWQAVYPDGSTSGWMPISVKTLAKTFNTAGTLPIVIQTQKDYSKANPSVKLIRQVTKTLYVMDQQYSGAASSSSVTGNLGVGGTEGFEITDASSGAVALAPYEVVVRSLVRDTISNELKLMVATSRTSNASSLLGTMAIDVFPIAGRPRIADLVKLPLFRSPEDGLTGNPVRIATTTLPNIIVGKPMADFPLQVAANSGVGPFSWYADSLPFGIKLSTSGVLSGTATALGSFTSDFAVVDSSNPPFIAHTTLALTVESDLKITTNALSPAMVSSPYSSTIVNTGGIPPFTWSIASGAPPTGLTLDAATGILSGTPVTYNSTTDFNKTYAFTVQVVDAIGAIASTVLLMRLVPAALQFGNPDQALLVPGETFEIAVPIFGGSAPYTLSSFTDDGVIGSGLRIANPNTIALGAGVQPPVLAATIANATVFPAQYPYAPVVQLSASGGVTPYTYSVIGGANTTLPNAQVFGNVLTGKITTDGTYKVMVQVMDLDGNTATQVVQIVAQQQNAGVYTIKPVSVNLNASNNPANWTVTPLTSLPDATNGAPYNAGSGSYWGLGVYKNGQPHFTQTAGGPSAVMNFSVLSGSLPTGIIAFSANSFSPSTDYSGLVLFNVSGGQNATANGSYSFEAVFADIVTDSLALTEAVARESITVTTAGGGTTPVVTITSGASTQLAPGGSIDPHYTLVTSADPSGPGPNAYVTTPTWPGGWVANGVNSQWITPTPSFSAAGGTYVYQTTFNLSGVDPTTAVLTGMAAADDTLVITLNGHQVGPTLNGNWNTLTPFTIDSGFVDGLNTLQFTVTNESPANPTGLQVEISGVVQSAQGPVEIAVYGTGTLQSGAQTGFVVNLATASGSPFTWYYPLAAEGGVSPYTFYLQSGTTLPGATITTLNGLPALASTTTTPGLYNVLLQAKDANGVASGGAELTVEIIQTAATPIYIVDSNLPAYVYANQPLPPNTYYFDSNIPAAWSQSGLPAGVTLSPTIGTRTYLSGTPTASGSFPTTVTAIATASNATTSKTVTLAVRAQSATFINQPTSAIVGTAYRVSTNNAVLQVRYTGYQPGDASLPLVASRNGTVGAPSVFNGGVATTSISNLTADGFVMSFDYTCGTPGTDVITLGNNLASFNLSVAYPQLVATGTTVAAQVSEYSTSATLAIPVTVRGGLAPYTLTPTGFSDSRFTAQSGQIIANVGALPAGQTTNCAVSILVTDAAGDSTLVTGTVQVAVQRESYTTVNFSNANWSINLSGGTPVTAFLIPNRLQSVPKLGHSPYQFYVDSVTLPPALSGFVQVSPSKRVLAVQVNSNSASASIQDVDAALNASGNFVVPAVAPSSAPAAGSYQIQLALRVVDALGLASSQTVTTTLIIS